MVEYICDRCKKIFDHKGNYMTHNKRKYPCKALEEIIVEDTKYELLMKKIDELEKKNNTLEKEVDKLKDRCVPKIINNTNTNTDNSKTLNVIITPSAFGKEDLNFLDDIQSKRILSKGFQSLPTLIKALHFNEDKPEYHNVYMPNWRDKNNVLVFDGKTWNLQNKNMILEDLRDKGIDFIQRKYDELKADDKKDAIIIRKIKRFMESYDNEKKLDVLNNDLQLVLYNNRVIVENTRKGK